MSTYTPPPREQNNLVHAALRLAGMQYENYEIDPDRLRKALESVANRARMLVLAIDALPEEQQPRDWTVTDEDPSAKASRYKEKLDFFAGFNRELSEENEQLRARLDDLQHYAVMTELGHYSITWDKDNVRIWCDRCPGSTIPFGTLANGGSGKPYSMTSVVCNIQEHELEHREGRV